MFALYNNIKSFSLEKPSHHMHLIFTAIFKIQQNTSATNFHNVRDSRLHGP